MMGKVHLFFFVLFLFALFVSVDGQGYNLRYHLSTKTMYWVQQLSYTQPPQGCTPVQINHLARHGARYPSSSQVSQLNTLQTIMRQNAQYYNPQYQWMGNWTNHFESIYSNVLTYSGQVEHYNMAQRLKKLYPEFMSSKFQPFIYDFQSTQVSRTGQSGVSFGYSLQQNEGHIPPVPQPGFQPFFIYSDTENEDTRLRFFQNCPIYQSSVENNSTANLQADLYAATQVQAAATSLAQRIGVYPHWQITADQLLIMYQTCGYQIATANITDEFCMLFEEDIATACEYYNDLNTYYNNGYGYPVNYQPACILLNEFFSIHEQFINGSNKNLLGKFRFAHAETHMPFVSLLGLFKDPTPLLANWTTSQIENRQWQSSSISPFAASVFSVLYQCGNGTSADYKLKLFVNEKEEYFPGCTELYCDFNQVKSQYAQQLTCPFVDLCYPDASVCDYFCPA